MISTLEGRAKLNLSTSKNSRVQGQVTVNLSSLFSLTVTLRSLSTDYSGGLALRILQNHIPDRKITVRIQIADRILKKNQKKLQNRIYIYTGPADRIPFRCIRITKNVAMILDVPKKWQMYGAKITDRILHFPRHPN